MLRDLSDKVTGNMHAAVRNVLRHHKLTKVGDGVVEADLIHAVLGCLEGKVTKQAPQSFEHEDLVEGFECKSSCGRVYFIPLSVVRQDYAEFLNEQDGIDMEEAYARVDEAPDFLETWFAEQFYWPDIAVMGVVVKQPDERQVSEALDLLRDNFGVSHTQACTRVKRVPVA